MLSNWSAGSRVDKPLARETRIRCSRCRHFIIKHITSISAPRAEFSAEYLSILTCDLFRKFPAVKVNLWDFRADALVALPVFVGQGCFRALCNTLKHHADGIRKHQELPGKAD